MKTKLQTSGIKYLDSSGQQGVFDEKTFRFVLRRERARADRTGRPVSLVVFHLPKHRSKSSDRWLLNALARRIRITDMIGWIDSSSLGILLPETSTDGAVAFLEKIVPILSDAESIPGIRVHTYPQQESHGGSGEQPIAGGRTVNIVPDSSTETSPFFSNMLAVSPPILVSLVERSLAGVALVVLSPLFLLIALIIKASSSGPVFFRQERIGQEGQSFYCYKFRTMRLHSETKSHEDYFSYLIENSVPMEKLDSNGDSRIFPAGHVLRAASLDELPQLINIFKGEMRLVGPRPCTPHEFEQYLPWHRHRVDAPPGLTGLWQVSGKNKTTFAQMIRLDLHYIHDRSVIRDIGIILKTVPVAIGLYFEDRFGKKNDKESLDDAPFLNSNRSSKETTEKP